MKLIRGQFWNNGAKVPLEHGNKEQIDLLKRVEILRDGVFSPDKHILCVCGLLVWKSDPVCSRCYMRYEWYTDGPEEIPCIKLID